MPKLCRPKPAKSFKKSRRILAGIGGLVLFTFALLPALLFPQYTPLPATGPYAVATAAYTYTDPARTDPYKTTGAQREVNLAAWYPENAGRRFLLLVFDHGFSGIRYSNESAFRQLASHGYGVVSLDHPGQSFYTVNTRQALTIVDGSYLQEYQQYGTGNADKAETLAVMQGWLAVRTADLNFAIDTVLKNAAEPGADPVYQTVDPAHKIGLFGHSLGAATAVLLGRQRSDVGAVADIDGPMLSELTGVKNGHFTVNTAPCPAPVLNLYSEYVHTAFDLQDDYYAGNLRVAATDPAAFEVVFAGAQHMTLTDLSLVSPFLANLLDGGRTAVADPAECLEAMNGLLPAFFDATLKGGAAFSPPAMVPAGG